jgi:hypothetical protein
MVLLARALALDKTGNNIAAKTAMMAITTSNSIRLNPWLVLGLVLILIGTILRLNIPKLNLAANNRKRGIDRFLSGRLRPRVAAPGAALPQLSTFSVEGQSGARIFGLGRLCSENSGQTKVTFPLNNEYFMG